MIAVLAASLAFASMPTSQAEEGLRSYRERVGPAWNRGYCLSDRQGNRKLDAIINRDQVWIRREENGRSEAWQVNETDVTHRFENGFVGRAAVWRKVLAQGAVAVLNGTILTHQVQRVSCRRRHKKCTPTIQFSYTNEVTIIVELDPVSKLPTASTIYDGVGRIQLSDLKFAVVDSTVVPIAWTSGDNRYSFRRITHCEKLVEANLNVLPTAPPFEQFSLKLVPGKANRTTRGVEVSVNGERAVFMVDTGSNFTTINAAFAAKIKIAPNGSQIVQTVSGYAKAPVLTLPRLKLGNIEFSDEPVAIFPTTFGFDGVIGLALFSRGTVQLSDDMITIAPSLQKALDGSQIIDTYDGVPIAEASISGKPIRVLFDSGFALSALFSAHYVDHGQRFEKTSDQCQNLGLPIFQAPRQVFYPLITIGKTSTSVDACVTAFEEIGQNFAFQGIVGFPLINHLVKSWDYRNAVFQ